MIKVVILLDCDECGQSFYKGHVLSSGQLTNDTEMSITTQLAALRLKQCAELGDWCVMGKYCLCPECVLEEEKMADWLEEPEGYRD